MVLKKLAPNTRYRMRLFTLSPRTKTKLAHRFIDLARKAHDSGSHALALALCSRVLRHCPFDDMDETLWVIHTREEAYSYLNQRHFSHAAIRFYAIAEQCKQTGDRQSCLEALLEYVFTLLHDHKYNEVKPWAGIDWPRALFQHSKTVARIACYI